MMAQLGRLRDIQRVNAQDVSWEPMGAGLVNVVGLGDKVIFHMM